MISEKENISISKFLSLVLRHKPETIDIELDEYGWTDVQNLIEKLNQSGVKIDRAILNHVVETNSKKRFAFNETFDKIRASQGHSMEVELGYEPQVPPLTLFHGTAKKFADSIWASGIHRQSRQHVHLSSNIGTAINVGKRHGEPYVLEILSAEMHEAGHPFYLSENGVWLTENVPVKFLRGPVQI